MNISLFIQKYHFYNLLYISTLSFIFLTTLHEQTPDFIIYIPLGFAFIQIIIDALKNILNRKISTELFIVVATIIGLLAGQTREITVMLLIMLAAKYFETLIESHTDQAIASLIKLVPTHVRIIVNNEEKIVPCTNIKPNTLISIKTGEQIQVDGVITQGQAHINEASPTGTAR